MSMARDATRWSHEQTWVSATEREALRSIERRLRRDGLRLDVRDRFADWPYQLAGLVLTAGGASAVTVGAAAAANPLTGPLVWLGAALLLMGALVAVTPIRASTRRGVRWVMRRTHPSAWFRRAPGG